MPILSSKLNIPSAGTPLLYREDGEQLVERYYSIIYRFLTGNGVAELYKENPLIFDERIFAMVCSMVERLNGLLEDENLTDGHFVD